MKDSTLSNDWNVVLHGFNVLMDFIGFGPGDYVQVAHSGGQHDVTEDNIIDWLQCDATDPGYHHLSEEESVASVSSRATADPETDSDSEEEGPTMKLSELRSHLEKALEGMTQYEGFENYYVTLRDIRAKVLQRQRSA